MWKCYNLLLYLTVLVVIVVSYFAIRTFFKSVTSSMPQLFSLLFLYLSSSFTYVLASLFRLISYMPPQLWNQP